MPCSLLMLLLLLTNHWPFHHQHRRYKVKVKVPSLQACTVLWVDKGIALLNLRPRNWRWGWVVSTRPRPLYPRKRPGNYYTGGWVGHRAGLDGCEKSPPPPGFNPRTDQPVASRYTDWSLPAALYTGTFYKNRRPPYNQCCLLRPVLLPDLLLSVLKSIFSTTMIFSWST